MTLNDLLLIALIASLAYIVWLHTCISRVAIAAAKRHCEKEGVQLLDQNVVLKHISIKLSPRSLFAIKRRYAFEFSSVGDRRYKGYINLLGRRVENIELAPFKIM